MRIQKFIRLVNEKKSCSNLPPTSPWREKFNSFSIDSRNILYIDQRLVIPKDIPENVLRAIRSGHRQRCHATRGIRHVVARVHLD